MNLQNQWYLSYLNSNSAPNGVLAAPGNGLPTNYAANTGNVIATNSLMAPVASASVTPSHIQHLETFSPTDNNNSKYMLNSQDNLMTSLAAIAQQQATQAPQQSNLALNPAAGAAAAGIYHNNLVGFLSSLHPSVVNQAVFGGSPFASLTGLTTGNPQQPSGAFLADRQQQPQIQAQPTMGLNHYSSHVNSVLGKLPLLKTPFVSTVR